MTEKLRFFVLLCLAWLTVACEVSINTDNRSGTLEDDYIEEPLGFMSEKYENALRVSNEFVDRMRDGSIDSIYSGLFSEELRGIVSKQDFEKVLAQIFAAKGKITKYKKMQWGFISGKENGRDFLASVKIVEHEKGMMKYLVVFNDDGKFDEIVGFRFKEREGVSPPGQF